MINNNNIGNSGNNANSDAPIIMPITSNVGLENMSNERLVALAKSNDQHKQVSEMLLKTAQSDLAISRIKVEELAAQVEELKKELEKEKSSNEIEKIAEVAATVSKPLNSTPENQSLERESSMQNNKISRGWDRDSDMRGNIPNLKKDMNNEDQGKDKEKEKEKTPRLTDEAATNLVKSALLTPRSPAAATATDSIKPLSGGQRPWADADDDEEEEVKVNDRVTQKVTIGSGSNSGAGEGAHSQSHSSGQGQGNRPGQGQGPGQGRGGGGRFNSTYSAPGQNMGGRDRDMSSPYGRGQRPMSSSFQSQSNNTDADKNRGMDRDRDSHDQPSSFGGRGNFTRMSTSQGGRGIPDRGPDRGPPGTGGNVARPLRVTKIIPPSTPGGIQTSESGTGSGPVLNKERSEGHVSGTGSGPGSGTGTGSGTGSGSTMFGRIPPTNKYDSTNSSSSSKPTNTNSNSIIDDRKDKNQNQTVTYGNRPNSTTYANRSNNSPLGPRDVGPRTDSNLGSPARRKGPPAQFISNSPESVPRGDNAVESSGTDIVTDTGKDGEESTEQKGTES